jgi:CRISPR-associated endonuclease/helicase Cas3
MSGGRKVDWGAVDGGERSSTKASPRAPASTRPAHEARGEGGGTAAAFDSHFESLTGHAPFPWQRTLFDEFVHGRVPSACDLPTGLGKTSVIAIWLLALAYRAGTATMDGFPRRLAYVVNRRTVVDQATREAEGLRTALRAKRELGAVARALEGLAARAADAPFAISTLRGQFADNAEWRADPARPAVIVGTVDMIGSRLLFSGYGCGFRSRPLHAGLLGQDTLLVHDEAHLEPAFQGLLTTIAREQARCTEFGTFRVMALTATSRGGEEPFRLTARDRANRVVRKRIEARKTLRLVPTDDEKTTADSVARRALDHGESGQAVIVFLRKLEAVEKVAAQLQKAKLQVQLLTGTMRGLERDALAKDDPIFARFVRGADGPSIARGTVYLLCTSAGEVGVDISADQMVCDLTPFDSMAQRLGRVNRYGEGDARVDVVVPVAFDEKDPLGEVRARTLALLKKLPKDGGGHDASPSALGELPPELRLAAFTPPPIVPAASDILFDAWSLTSIRQALPGRPPVADWLHGVAEWEPPETRVAWREEVELLDGVPLLGVERSDLLEDFPLKPHELLRDRSDRVWGHLITLAQRHPEAPVWIVDSDGLVEETRLETVARRRKDSLADRTVLLPPKVGGLGLRRDRATGMLDGDARFDESLRRLYDVADEWRDGTGDRLRWRGWEGDDPPKGMRLVRTIDTRPDAEEDPEESEGERRRHWRWYARPRAADDDGSRTARRSQELAPHHGATERFALTLVEKLGLPEHEASAIVLAARWHDLGKHRLPWQRAVGNADYPRLVLAKSANGMRPRELSAYRHELGSILDLAREGEFQRLAPEIQELVLHFIAAHHGRARPHFPAAEVLDPDHPDPEVAAAVAAVPARFARLQRKYGRWGLAYLESMVRAADALASQEQEPVAADAAPERSAP